MIVEQLPLGFRLKDDATFENFLSLGNEQALESIIATIQGTGDNYIYIWGAAGSGRTHLLQACTHAAPEFGQSAVYLPLAKDNIKSDMFNNLENISLTCLDDIDQIAGDCVFEEQLFHLYNKIRSKGNRLIIAANAPPTQLNIKLADLGSRLTWGLVYQLHPLDDDAKIKALKLRAKNRGLELDDAVGKFLLRRCSRKMGALFSMLEELDHASLSQQRRLTIPFVKEVLRC